MENELVVGKENKNEEYSLKYSTGSLYVRLVKQDFSLYVCRTDTYLVLTLVQILNFYLS